MNTHIQTACTNLLTASAPLPALSAPPLTPCQAARLLIAHAREHGPLPLLGAWRLHPVHSRLLERAAHGAPLGGWAALAGVLAGTPLMQIRDDGFVALISQPDLDAMSDEDIGRTLIEALTVRMAPPCTAAGLFILMGINPIAGLHLARIIHDSLPASAGRHTPEQLDQLHSRIAQQDTAALATCFFGAIAAILQLLATLDPARAYSNERLAQTVLHICKHQRTQLERACDATQRAQIFSPNGHADNEDRLMELALDFTILDLLDGLLIPAGLARRIEGGLFCVTAAARRTDFDNITLTSHQAREALFADLLHTPSHHAA
jgi:hypothetical protein